MEKLAFLTLITPMIFFALATVSFSEKNFPERKDVITSHGNPLSILGPELKIGDKAPDFQLMNNDLQPVTLSDYKDKIKIISVVPSLDTKTCSLQTHRFNELASKMDSNIVIITVSMDLPFAQKRWCGANGIDKVVTLSDYKDHSFGLDYGVIIKELGLLSRTVFILDKENTIRYIQRVPEISHEPDYDEVLKALDTIK